MGMQSAVAHRVGVPGITTTYFTGTLTGIVMGSIGGTPAAEGQSRRPRRLQWPVLAFLAYVAARGADRFAERPLRRGWPA